MAPSAAWMLPSVRMRSLRDRRMMAAGSRALLVVPSGCACATYSTPAITRRVGRVLVSTVARAGAAAGPSVEARTVPSIAKAMSAPVSDLNWCARPSSSRMPMLRTPRTSGLSRPTVTGTLTTSSTPRAWGQNAGDTTPAIAAFRSGVGSMIASRSPARASVSPRRLVTMRRSAPACR